MSKTGYLQHARDWGITKDAIIRLSASLGGPFTYGDLAEEIEDHDGLLIDGRGYAGALEAVAKNLSRTEPLWTCMVINADTREVGDGFWGANTADQRYSNAAGLSAQSREIWMKRQRDWCVAAARVELDPLSLPLRERESELREEAAIWIDLLLDERKGSE